MSMPELTDDQLDGLFRKSVEELDTPFDQAAWQDMKARLDANDRTTPGGALIWKNLLRWGLPVALLLLLTGGSWFVYRKANPGIETTPLQKVASPRSELTLAKGVNQAEAPRLANTERPTVPPASSREQQANEIGQSANRGESANEPGKIETSIEAPSTRLTESTGSEPGKVPTISNIPTHVEAETSPNASFDKTKGNNATNSGSTPYELVTGKKRTNRLKYSKESVTKTYAGRTLNRLSKMPIIQRREFVGKFRRQHTPGRELAALSTSTNTLSSTSSFSKPPVTTIREAPNPDFVASNSSLTESNEVSSMLLPTVYELTSRPARWPKSLTFTERPVEAQPDTTASVQRTTPKLPPMRGLSVRFEIAPDLSSVGLKNYSRPGTNIGLLLEYRLAARWSIQAGLIQSTKVYKALPSEYTAPSTWWQYPMKSPDWVDGRCTMFDIPINIRYDVVVKPRLDGRLPTRWFVSGGITSYIIKNEEYYYTYPPHTYGQATEYNPPASGGYGFSNLNLSVGYERSISRRLSWQVEPFMKAPLKGVGFFKVNLLSSGVFFSLRYKL